MSFGENLISLRESRHMSRGDLATLLDIPYTTLRNYETDQREPGHKLLIKIANSLNVSVDSLIGNAKISPVPTEPEANTKWQKIHSNFEKLNDAGQDRLAEYSDFLITREEYQKERDPKPVETVRVWQAARSTDNSTPSGWVDMPKEEVEKIFNTPDADVDF